MYRGASLRLALRAPSAVPIAPGNRSLGPSLALRPLSHIPVLRGISASCTSAAFGRAKRLSCRFVEPGQSSYLPFRHTQKSRLD